MRRLVGLLTLLVPALGHAQPGATEPLPPAATVHDSALSPPGSAPVAPLTDPQVVALARGTHAAAARGDCVGARVLGSQIARLDPEFHRTVIKTDPVITHCRPAPRPVSVAALEPSDADLPVRSGTPPISGGVLAGELLLGTVFTIGGGLAGGYLGHRLTERRYEEGIGGAILGAFVGGTIMAAVGVNLVGNSGEAEGSFGLAVGGALIGGVVGVGVAAASLGSDGDGGGALLVLLVAPTVGAMLGHNLLRTYKPQRAARPGIDRRMAVLPSARIEDGVGFTLAGGSF